MLKATHMVTDKTPSLQELFNKDFSAASKSNDEECNFDREDPKPVFIAA